MNDYRFKKIINRIQITSLLVIGSTMLFISCIGAYNTFYDKSIISHEKTQHKAKNLANKTPEPDVINAKAPNDIACKVIQADIDYYKIKSCVPIKKKLLKKKKEFVTHVTLTIYHPVAKECDSTPDKCASGRKVDFKGLKNGTFRVVAISRDLQYALPFHSTIYIDGYGFYQVEDLMHQRYNHYIDIMLHPQDKRYFKEEKVKVTKIA